MNNQSLPVQYDEEAVKEKVRGILLGSFCNHEDDRPLIEDTVKEIMVEWASKQPTTGYSVEDMKACWNNAREIGNNVSYLFDEFDDFLAQYKPQPVVPVLKWSDEDMSKAFTAGVEKQEAVDIPVEGPAFGGYFNGTNFDKWLEEYKKLHNKSNIKTNNI